MGILPCDASGLALYDSILTNGLVTLNVIISSQKTFDLSIDCNAMAWRGCEELEG